MRDAMVIGLHDDRVEEHRRFHAAIWPDELAMVSANGMFLKEPENLLFCADHGDDHAEAAHRINAATASQRRHRLTEPCQRPLGSRKSGAWLAVMEPVFHLD